MGITIRIRQSLSVGLAILLVFTMGPASPTSTAQAVGSPLPADTPPAPTYPGQGAPYPSEELKALVAPIALYPDALVAQILMAALPPPIR